MSALAAFLLVCTAGVPNDAVLVHFSSSQCAPCRAVEPVVQQLERDGIVVRHVNVEREPELAHRFAVQQVPTFLVLRSGREVQRLVGVQDRETLLKAVIGEVSGRLSTTSASPASFATSAAAPALQPIAPAVGQTPTEDLASAVLRAERATVRIRVYDGSGFGVGTGTIIDTHGEEALVITCGHIFRDSKGKGRIEVDLFIGGRVQTVAGSLIDFDAETRDIGLLSIQPGVPVAPVPVAPAQERLMTGASAFSYGCDEGADPSRRETRITALNKFQGPQNVEIAGAPVVGRSGGGLFDSRGRLIGVCNAADHQDNEGLYAGPEVIGWQLSRADMQHLVEGGTQVAAAAPAVTIQPASMELASSSAMTGSADEEVICIIRSRSNPAAAPRVMTIASPTPELLKMLENR